MVVTDVMLKDIGTALDAILGLFGVPVSCKVAFTSIALIKASLRKDTSPEGQLKNLAVEIFDSIKKFTEKEVNADDAEAVISAVKESLEQFNKKLKNNREDIKNIFTDYVNEPNDLIKIICNEHNSLGGEAEECYQRIIQMIVTTLCDEKSVELFLNQNYALVQLLKNNDNLSKELAEASGKIDELLKRNYLIESQLPPLSKRNPFKYSYEKIGFYGRKDELKQIENFMLANTQFTFWSITGKGGTGKSKLALHIAQEYIKRGWVVIWCESKTSYDNLLEKEFIHPTLFIFDYAGSRKEEIRTVITRAKDKTQNIRLLFVERDKYTATSGMGVETWYSQIFNDKEISTYKEDEYSLDSLNLGALDNEAIKSILDDFATARAKELSLDKNKFKEDEKDNIIRYVKETLPRNGANADFSDRCLFILFTADACLQEKSYLDWGAKELLDNYISQYSQKLPQVDNLKSHLNLLAIATATGGIDIEDEENNSIESLSSCIEKLKNDFSYDNDITEGQAFIKSLCEKDEVDNIITPMYPDLVGEYFFISRISKQSSTTVKKWIKHIFLNEKYKDYFTTFIVRGLMDWDTQDEWHSFVDWVINELNSNSDNKMYLADLYSELASGYGTKGNYAKQFEYCDKARQIYEKLLFSNPSEFEILYKLVMTYNDLGNTYVAIGKYDEAIKQHKKVINTYKNVLPTNHQYWAISYDNIGIAYNRKGEYDKAIEYHKKALKIYEGVLSPNLLDLAMTYNNLGNTYHYKGEYDKAIKNLNKALKNYKEVLSSNHPKFAVIYSSLGTVYMDQGRYDKAMELYEKSLKIYQEVLSSNHPDMAMVYNNLGSVYRYKGEYDKAIEQHKKALKIREEVLSSNHPDLAGSYNNLGSAYHYKGKYDKAIKYYEKALKIREEVLPPNHPNLAGSYNNLGGAYSNKGDNDKAIEHFEKALKIYKEVLPSNHPYLAMSYNNLGVVYENKGDNDKAIEYYEKALAIYKIALPNHPNIIVMYKNIIKVYKKLNDTENAQKYIDELESLQKNDI